MTLTNVDSKPQMGKVAACSNNLQSKVVNWNCVYWSKSGKAALQQTPLIDASSCCGRGRCRCGSVKALKCSWHSGVHPSFFWGCKLYTKFDQVRHDRAVGLRGQLFEVVISSTHYNSHLLQSDLSRMEFHLNEAKKYDTNIFLCSFPCFFCVLLLCSFCISFVCVVCVRCAVMWCDVMYVCSVLVTCVCIYM